MADFRERRRHVKAKARRVAMFIAVRDPRDRKLQRSEMSLPVADSRAVSLDISLLRSLHLPRPVAAINIVALRACHRASCASLEICQGPSDLVAEMLRHRRALRQRRTRRTQIGPLPTVAAA